MTTFAPPLTMDPPPADALAPGAWPTRFTAIESGLAGLVERLEPANLLATDAAGVLDALVRIEKRIAGAKVLVAARAADAGLWRTAGERSAAHWVARRSGTSVAEADGVLTASTRIGDLPVVEESLRRGELSGAQARLVTEAAAADPTRQRDVLDAARSQDLRGLRDVAERIKQQAEPDEDAQQARIHRRRGFHHATSGGELRYWGSMTADAGSLGGSAAGPVASGSALQPPASQATAGSGRISSAPPAADRALHGWAGAARVGH